MRHFKIPLLRIRLQGPATMPQGAVARGAGLLLVMGPRAHPYPGASI